MVLRSVDFLLVAYIHITPYQEWTGILNFTEVLSFGLSALMVALLVCGFIAWILFCLVFGIYRFRDGFAMNISRELLIVMKIFSHRLSVIMLFAGALYLPWALSPNFYAATTMVGFSLGFGVCVCLILNGPWLPVPLGKGLSFTVDKASGAGRSISKYVINFHVDERLITNRKLISDLLVKAFQTIEASGCAEHIVLKSWIFASRVKESEGAVERLQVHMRLASRVFSWGGDAVLKTVSLAVVSYVLGLSYLSALIFVLLSGLVIFLVFFVVVTFFRVRFWVGSIIFSFPRDGWSSGMYHLSRYIQKKADGFECEFISPKAISTIQLISMSLRGPAVFESCAGVEAGIFFVLRRR
ncbi:hypothetical protein SAMN05444065_10711 [Pseudomonas syringae]|uniref:Uncharacterized protein n=1 Tax=Pseudomonas syringae TaxID=317 RepID=A0AB38BTQ7_PSESX|nr:hypothetical protein SAMN05444065_10711 [Pseudomonas syringae]SFO61918.1 hypothetical protein SAMN05444063_111145 [Pseudomonas syringae]